MTRWSIFLLLVGVGCGCRSPYNIYAPYGPQCVPPPATGTVGQPYYQPNPYGQTSPYGQPNPYGTYPGYPTYPQYPYSTGAAPTYPPPTVSQQPSFSQSSYIPDQNGWSSTASYNAPSSSGSAVGQPRPSGQFLTSNLAQNLRQNDQLPWSSSRGSNGVMADAIPTVINSSVDPIYGSPIRPSIVRSNQVATYEPPTAYQAPIYYDQDYVLDPYANAVSTTMPANYIDPYGGNGTIAATSGWSSRR